METEQKSLHYTVTTDVMLDDFYDELSSRYHTFHDMSVFQLHGIENNKSIHDIRAAVDRIVEVFKKFEIPTEDDTSEMNPDCVYAFKYLLLNTSFKCQPHFIEDVGNNLLIDRCKPSISPYILMEVLRELEYENILAESLLHLPLDLCAELLEATRSLICRMHFERRFTFLTRLIFSCHRKLMIVTNVSAESLDFPSSLDRLFIYTQQLIALLMSDHFLSLNDTTAPVRSERLGYVLKGVITLTMNCLGNERKNVLPKPEISKMYSVSFGERVAESCNGKLAQQMCMLNQEFVYVLMRKAREIDVNGKTYRLWSSLESPENPSVNLQRSIRNDLYRFIKFMNEYEYLRLRGYLEACFAKFNPEPLRVEDTLDFSGLDSRNVDERRKCLKDVLSRYKDWNHASIDIIRRNRELLDSDDVLTLNRYLAYILQKPGHRNHKNRVSLAIRAIIYDRVKPHIFKLPNRKPRYVTEDRVQCLYSSHSAIKFEKYISDNKDIKTPKNLHRTLMYAVNDPFGVASSIARAAIGASRNTTITPADLVLLYPVLSLMRTTNVVSICIGKTYNCRFDPNKFAALADVMMSEHIITANEVVNRFISSWLHSTKPKRETLMCMLNYCNTTLTPKFTARYDVSPIVSSLGHTMAAFRKDIEMPRMTRDETLEAIAATVEPYTKMYTRGTNGSTTEQILNIAKCAIMPIDRYKPPFWVLYLEKSSLCKSLNVMINMWAYDCFVSFEYTRSKQKVLETDPAGPKKSADFNRFADDFLRNAFIVSTQKEHVELAMIAIMGGNCFWNYSKGNSYEKAVRITIEAALYFLEFPELNNPQSFACSMTNLAQLTHEVVAHQVNNYNNMLNQCREISCHALRKIYDCYKPLRECLKMLEDSIKHTVFSSFYATLIEEVNDPKLDGAPRGVAIYVIENAVRTFADKCLKVPHVEVKYSHAKSPQTARYKLFYEFVKDCIECDRDVTLENSRYQSLCETYRILSAEQTTDNCEPIIGKS